MTCRATRRERVLVSRGVHPHYRADARDLLRRRPRARRDPARRGRAGRRHDRPRRARADARRRRTGRSPASIAAQPNFLGLLEPMPEIGRAGPRRRRAVRRASSSRCRLAVLAPPGAYGADIAAGEGQPLGHRAAVRRPVPRDPRLDRRARPPDPRPAGRDDDRPRRPARLRDDAARARAGHPARQGGQQHLHQPGAARARGVDLPRDDRSARAARRRRARAPPGPPSSRRPSPRSARRGSTRARTSTSSSSGSRTRRRSIARLLDRGVLAGLVLADAVPDDPTPRRRPARLRDRGDDDGRDRPASPTRPRRRARGDRADAATAPSREAAR